MNHPSTVKLEPTVRLSAGKELQIRARVVNGGTEAIYVYATLWTLDALGHFIADPGRIYRFVQGGTLRLLFGACPLPRAMTPLYRNIPHVKLVKPDASLTVETALPMPVEEHNVYFPPQPNSRFEQVEVSQTELFVQYLEARQELMTRASLVDPASLEILTPTAHESARTLRSAPIPLTLSVRRRTDAFERLRLPGEPPEKP
jgi:hypothetical protein